MHYHSNANLSKEIANIKAKKLPTNVCIRELQTIIGIYSMEVERKRNFNHLTKANPFRKAVTGKKEVKKKSLENALANLEKELKLM